MTPTRAAIVATAGEAVARRSWSLALAGRLLDRRTRERMWLLRAWRQACGGTADAETIRTRTEAALAGAWVGEPGFDGLRILVEETGMPHRLVWDAVEGFADEGQPRHEEDLYLHCYRTMGTIACMAAVAMGVKPDNEATLDRACDLGIAFALFGIARDLAEDDRAGRCFLPADWLAEFDVPPGEHMKPPYRQRLVMLAARLLARAQDFAASGRAVAAALPFRSAWAVLAAATGIKRAVAIRVRAAGEHGWDHRVGANPLEQIEAIGRGFGEAMGRRRVPMPKRDELWSRPRG